MATISGGSTVASSTSRRARVNCFSVVAGSKRLSLFRVTSKPRSDCRTGSMMLRASGVDTIRWPWRTNSGSSNMVRSRPSAWLIAGWVRFSLALARVTLPSV